MIKNKRAARWIRSDYITGPESFDKYKVAVPAANGSGSTTDFFGVALNNPTVLEPGVAVTQTFITIGSFDTEAEAQACLKYVKSKFARAMLGVLKVTQHNPRSTWKYRPDTGLHDRLGHRLDQVDPRDRRPALRQVRTRRRRDRLHRGQGQADGLAAGAGFDTPCDVLGAARRRASVSFRRPEWRSGVRQVGAGSGIMERPACLSGTWNGPGLPGAVRVTERRSTGRAAGESQPPWPYVSGTTCGGRGRSCQAPEHPR